MSRNDKDTSLETIVRTGLAEAGVKLEDDPAAWHAAYRAGLEIAKIAIKTTSVEAAPSVALDTEAAIQQLQSDALFAYKGVFELVGNLVSTAHTIKKYPLGGTVESVNKNADDYENTVEALHRILKTVIGESYLTGFDDAETLMHANEPENGVGLDPAVTNESFMFERMTSGT